MSEDPILSSKSKESAPASALGVILLGFLVLGGVLLVIGHRAHPILGGAILILLVVSLVLAAFNKRGR